MLDVIHRINSSLISLFTYYLGIIRLISINTSAANQYRHDEL